jgi:hypothetical protein
MKLPGPDRHESSSASPSKVNTSEQPVPIGAPVRGCESEHRFYFVCSCEAKWFSRRNAATCPRCGATHRSDLQIVPP